MKRFLLVSQVRALGEIFAEIDEDASERITIRELKAREREDMVCLTGSKYLLRRYLDPFLPLKSHPHEVLLCLTRNGSTYPNEALLSTRQSRILTLALCKGCPLWFPAMMKDWPSPPLYSPVLEAPSKEKTKNASHCRG